LAILTYSFIIFKLTDARLVCSFSSLDKATYLSEVELFSSNFAAF